MNDTQAATEYNAVPHDPVMAAADPAMFAPLTGDENKILGAHLTSGWYKQAAVYPVLSEPWRETSALKEDLSGAWRAAWHAAHPGAGHGEPEAPEAGHDPGGARDASVTAPQAATEAVRECGGTPGGGTPAGDRAAGLPGAADAAGPQSGAAAMAGPEAS